MGHAEYASDDLRIFLSENEAWNLGPIMIEGNKIVGIPLTIPCAGQNGEELTVVIQKIDFESLGDGVILERTPNGFYIRINHRALDRLLDNSITGTRYDSQNKVTLFKE